MSQAHRPTWNPTQGRESKAGSQQVSKRSLASHTRLKFRQPGQTSSSDIARRDLRAELAAAERVAEDKKRKAAGLPALPPLPSAAGGAGLIEDGSTKDGEEEEKEDEASKRRKILEEAAELDKDDADEDEDEGEEVNGAESKGKGKAVEEDDEDEEEDDDDDEDDSDDDDDAAALMAELAKIKAERAEEKARLDAESAASLSRDRDAEIATGNPLLNLAAALGQAPGGSGGATPGTPASTIGSSAGFAVKRRWDDDLIFKNQASGLDDKPKKGEFVNDLLRSEFHKKFMYRFIK